MKYLHDNGFRVLLLNQLGYDPNNNTFYIKKVPSSTFGITTNKNNTTIATTKKFIFQCSYCLIIVPNEKLTKTTSKLTE